MKIERILITTFLLGELTLLLNIPFGETALTIAGLILSFGYLILSNWIFIRKENNPSDVSRVFAGFILFLFSIGILFRLKVWPTGHLILLVSFFFGIIYLSVSFISILRNKVDFKQLKPILFRIATFFVFASIVYFTSGRTILNFQYVNNPERRKEIIEILEYRDWQNKIENESH